MSLFKKLIEYYCFRWYVENVNKKNNNNIIYLYNIKYLWIFLRFHLCKICIIIILLFIIAIHNKY